jgi:hypothetical protein
VDSGVSEDEIVRADASTTGDDVASEAQAEDEYVARPEDSMEESEVGSSESGKEGLKKEASASVPDKEVITISDDKGRRQIEIDYTNRDAIKKAFQIQHGARKWQAERDKAIESTKKYESELSDLKKNWSQLDEAFKKGPEHLLTVLMGKPDAFQELINKEIEKREFLASASPAEIEAFKANERASTQAQELEKIRKENEDFRNRMEQEKVQTEEKALESKIHPSFEKYRFADKLNDPETEHMFDSMLWTTALDRLLPYEEKGVPLTKELVEKEFRTVAKALNSRINAQAEKKATKVVEQKKREAVENVQAKVSSGYKSGGNTAKEAQDLIKKGDLTTLLKGWGKYGQVFGKK